MKELLTDEHKLYRLAFAESNVDRKWDRVIFTDESIFTSANDGPVLVYRSQGQRYNPQYMSTCKRSGPLSVHCWSCISQDGAGVPHCIEGQLDSLHYQHILQNVMVPSVWMLYPEVIIHLQQDHSFIHDSSSSLQNTHHSQRTDIHATGRIRTHNLSRQGDVDRPATGTGEISHLLTYSVVQSPS